MILLRVHDVALDYLLALIKKELIFIRLHRSQQEMIQKLVMGRAIIPPRTIHHPQAGKLDLTPILTPPPGGGGGGPPRGALTGAHRELSTHCPSMQQPLGQSNFEQSLALRSIRLLEGLLVTLNPFSFSLLYSKVVTFGPSVLLKFKSVEGWVELPRRNELVEKGLQFITKNFNKNEPDCSRGLL